MQQLLIIVGIIIILSFITGIVLTVKENKSISKEVLTDDPKILFNDYIKLNDGKLFGKDFWKKVWKVFKKYFLFGIAVVLVFVLLISLLLMLKILRIF